MLRSPLTEIVGTSERSRKPSARVDQFVCGASEPGLKRWDKKIVGIPVAVSNDTDRAGHYQRLIRLKFLRKPPIDSLDPQESRPGQYQGHDHDEREIAGTHKE